MHVFLRCTLAAISGNRHFIRVMSSCARVALVSAALLKNTQYGNGSVVCRARYAVIESHVIIQWLN